MPPRSPQALKERKSDMDSKRTMVIVAMSLSLTMLLAGCAAQSVNREASHPAEPLTSDATSSPPSSAYEVDTRPGAGVPVPVYLVRTGANWSINLTGADLADGNVERLLYWPSERLVNIDFSAYKLKRADQLIVCRRAKDQIRESASGYTPCNTNFKKRSNPVAARVFAGIFSAGLTELDALAKGTETFKLDIEALGTILNEQQLDSKVAYLSYRNRFVSSQDKNALLSFIRDHAGDDPDRLVPLAREKVAAMEADEAELAKARSAVGDPKSYVKRYTPARPEKYCAAFAKDKESLQICRNLLPGNVHALASTRASTAYRMDICKRIDAQLGGPKSTALCGRYAASGQCTADAGHEKRICDIINSRG